MIALTRHAVSLLALGFALAAMCVVPVCSLYAQGHGGGGHGGGGGHPGGGFSGGGFSGGGHSGGGFSSGGHSGGGFSSGGHPSGGSFHGDHPGGGPSHGYHPGPGHGGHPWPGPRVGWHGWGVWPGFLWVGDFHFLLAPPSSYVVISFGGVNYYRCGYVYYRPYWYDDRWVYVEVPPPAGMVVTQLPPSPDRVVINGQMYYRSGTTFYLAQPAAGPTAAMAAPVEMSASTNATPATTSAAQVATAGAPTTTASTTTTNPTTTTASTTSAKATGAATAGGAATDATAGAATNAQTSGTSQPAGTAAGNVAAQTGPEIIAPGYVVAKPPIGGLVESLPGGTEKIQVGSTIYYRAADVYYLPITVGQKTQYVIVQKPN
jgi:hypothetical protein